MNTKTDGPPLLRRRHGMKPPRERGRPARTSLGTASAISSTRVDRQRRQDSASAEPMPFPPAGWPGAASQGNGAARNGIACGRDARAPGGGLLPSLLPLKGARAGLPGRSPCRCGSAVTLSGPSVESRGGAPALDRGSRCCRRLSPLAGASISFLAAFPRPRSSNRTCGFPASGFQSRSCLRPRMALWLRPQASESIGFP